MELRLFFLVVLFCALAMSLPANHARERRTTNPVIRSKGRDAMQTKHRLESVRFGSRYGRAWQPPSTLDDNVYGADKYDDETFQFRNLPLIEQLIAQLEKAEENGGY
ncbi:uncharacterized protein LOC121410784 [Lytechinus variegatus]|uniref:uncharacterized protein LOC121410784 n=1 Tax=Lytechinus variegatus TaxID=7654 RepID=UPI001BB1CF45|nr:uncharacterized protein LOC121410784 [Lytechinus variegatus]